MIYAGIGSRETPPSVLEYMTLFARDWAHDYEATLRSGGAIGADLAFEQGAIDGDGPLEIYYMDRYRIGYSGDADEDRFAKPGQTNVSRYDPVIWNKAFQIAQEYHPNWGACSSLARKLHARNSFIILGERLNDPVELVVCWTKDAKLQGGTAQGLRIAKDHGIVVANFGHGYGFDK